MFGFVMADIKELTKEEDFRYRSVYCGICRQMRLRHGNLARMGLSFDLAFLGLLLHSLYEPEETSGKRACGLHPLKPRPWIDSEYIAYCTDMNVALAYYKALDDQEDEGGAKAARRIDLFGKNMEMIAAQYPRQCKAMEEKLAYIRKLEQENCQNPDLPAGAFGELLEEVFVYKEDLWEQDLRQLANCLGRFIYLADGAVDYARDKKKGNYNPFGAMDPDWEKWTEYLVQEMAGCTESYERLPLVEDKHLMDNILYGGVWLQYRQKQKRAKHDGRSL